MSEFPGLDGAFFGAVGTGSILSVVQYLVLLHVVFLWLHMLKEFTVSRDSSCNPSCALSSGLACLT